MDDCRITADCYILDHWPTRYSLDNMVSLKFASLRIADSHAAFSKPEIPLLYMQLKNKSTPLEPIGGVSARSHGSGGRGLDDGVRHGYDSRLLNITLTCGAHRSARPSEERTAHCWAAERRTARTRDCWADFCFLKHISNPISI